MLSPRPPLPTLFPYTTLFRSPDPDVLQGEGERRYRRREGLLGIDDRRLAIGQLEDSFACGEGDTELAEGFRERLHRFEGRECEKREQRDQDAVEVASCVSGDRDCEHPDHRCSGDQKPEAVAGSVRERRSPRDPHQPSIRGAKPAEPLVLTTEGNELRAARK